MPPRIRDCQVVQLLVREWNNMQEADSLPGCPSNLLYTEADYFLEPRDQPTRATTQGQGWERYMQFYTVLPLAVNLAILSQQSNSSWDQSQATASTIQNRVFLDRWIPSSGVPLTLFIVFEQHLWFAFSSILSVTIWFFLQTLSLHWNFILPAGYDTGSSKRSCSQHPRAGSHHLKTAIYMQTWSISRPFLATNTEAIMSHLEISFSFITRTNLPLGLIPPPRYSLHWL